MTSATIGTLVQLVTLTRANSFIIVTRYNRVTRNNKAHTHSSAINYTSPIRYSIESIALVQLGMNSLVCYN